MQEPTKRSQKRSVCSSEMKEKVNNNDSMQIKMKEGLKTRFEEEVRYSRTLQSDYSHT